jgi:hypothetical protein
VVLEGALGGVICKNWAKGGDDFFINTTPGMKDWSVGEYPRRPVLTVEQSGITTVDQLVAFVFLQRVQASPVTYENEIGDEVPYAHRPGDQDVLRRTADGIVVTGEEEDESEAPAEGPGSSSGTDSSQPSSVPTTAGSEPSASGSHPPPPPRQVLSRPVSLLEETVVFNQGVKVMHEVFRSRTWYSNVNLKVFSSYRTVPPAPGSPEAEDPDSQQRVRRLRLVVYRVTSSAYSETVVDGFDDLREVVGTNHQHLLEPAREEEMFLHIAHSRMIVMEGMWNPEQDTYESEGDAFTLLLRRDRLYRMDKETPVHLGGEADEKFNKSKLIHDKNKRGRKVLRCAKNIQGTFLHVTVFEMTDDTVRWDEPPPPPKPADAIEAEKQEIERRRKKPFLVPALRLVSFDPKTGHKSVALPGREAILENVGGEFSPLLEPARRVELARLLVSFLMLKKPAPDADPIDIVLPYSGEKDVKLLRVGDTEGRGGDDPL